MSGGGKPPDRLPTDFAGAVQVPVDKTTLLLPEATSLVKEKLKEYIRDLVDETVRIAKANGVNLASPVHVDQAARHLVTRPASRVNAILSSIGGLMTGAGIQYIPKMLETPRPSDQLIVFTLTMLMFGPAMMVVGASKR